MTSSPVVYAVLLLEQDCDISCVFAFFLIVRPLMVSTQRLTSLAYNIVDGRSDSDKLSPNIKPYIVKYSATCLLLITAGVFD